MFGSRKGFQPRPPPPPKQRKKPAARPPRRKQLFAFDPVAAHYNALNHERRHGVTQPIVCVDLNAANERRRWRETASCGECVRPTSLLAYAPMGHTEETRRMASRGYTAVKLPFRVRFAVQGSSALRASR